MVRKTPSITKHQKSQNPQGTFNYFKLFELVIQEFRSECQPQRGENQKSVGFILLQLKCQIFMANHPVVV